MSGNDLDTADESRLFGGRWRFFDGFGRMWSNVSNWLGNLMRGLSTMMEAWSAKALFKEKKRQNAYNQVSVADDSSIDRILLECYELLVPHKQRETRSEKHALMQFSFSEVETITDDDLRSLQQKGCALLQQFNQYNNAEQLDQDKINKIKKEFYTFILLLIQQAHDIRHLDFSNYPIPEEAYGLFGLFLEDLLDCNPNITHITFHPDNQDKLFSVVQNKLNLHRCVDISEQILLDSVSPPGTITLEAIKKFFVKNQETTIHTYENRTKELLTTLEPDAVASLFEQDPMVFLSDSKKVNTPWRWIISMGEKLKQKLYSIAPEKEKIQEPIPLESRILVASPSTPPASTSSMVLSTPQSSSSGVLTISNDNTNSVINTFYSVLSDLTSFWKKQDTLQEDKLWYYFDTKAKPEEQLRERVKEAERIVSLFRIFSEIPSMHVPDDQDETLVKALAKAEIFHRIISEGLLREPKVDMSYLDTSRSEDKEAYLASMEREQEPIQQKHLLMHPDKINVSEQIWLLAYPNDGSTERMNKQELLKDAINILIDKYNTWIAEVNLPPEQGGLPCDITNEQGIKINKVQAYLKERGLALSTHTDLMKSHKASDARFQKITSQQDELIKINEKESEILEKITGNPELLAQTKKKFKENPALKAYLTNSDPTKEDELREAADREKAIINKRNRKSVINNSYLQGQQQHLIWSSNNDVNTQQKVLEEEVPTAGLGITS